MHSDSAPNARHDLHALPTIRSATDARCLGPVERRRGLSVEEFRREYLRGNKPVVLEGLMDDWPALRTWSVEWFRERYSGVPVTATRMFQKQWACSLGEYLDYARDVPRGPRAQATGDFPLYLDGWFFRRDQPELTSDFRVPEHVANDWFRFFPGSLDLAATGIMIGPRGCFTKLHYDLMWTHSWNAQIAGRKRWVLCAPQHRKDVYPKTRHVPGYFPGTDLDRPDLARYPRMASVGYYETILEPGEMIWFPAMWLHQVETLEDSISLTHNYCCANNVLPVVWVYLLKRLGARYLRLAARGRSPAPY